MNVKTCRMLGLALALVVIGAGCGTLTSVRALRKGESALAVSVGGPVAHVSGIDMPLPYMVARYRQGLNDRTGLYAGGHLTPALLKRPVIGIDLGVSHQLLNQKGWVPALSGSAGIVAYIQPGGEQALFPQLDIAASYLLGGRYLTYFGTQSMYQLAATPAVVLAPFVGEEVRLGRSLSLAMEAKWYGPMQKTKPRNVDYRMSIAGNGAVGFVVGVNYHFGGWYEQQ